MTSTTDRPMVLTLVRHSETAFNVAGQFRGRADPPLTEKGEAQAEAVAQALAPAIAVYASPRRRATAMADRIARRAATSVRVDPRLDDLDYGAWTGLTMDRARSETTAIFHEWTTHPEGVRFPGGESIEEATARLDQVLCELGKRHEAARVVVITHDALIRMCLCRALQAPLASMHRIRIDLASTSTFECIDDTIVVGKVNDTSHLGALLTVQDTWGALARMR